MKMKLFNFTQYADLPAFIEGDTSKVISYQDLEKSTHLFAASFVKTKSLCFLFIDSTADHLIAYLSLINLGHAVALFDASMHPDFKQRLITLYSPLYVIETSINTSLDIDRSTYEPIVTSLPSLLVWQHRFPAQSPSLHPELQLLLSTSGTTGNPKLIRLTSANILANATSICKYLDITHHDRAISSLPFHYSYGLSILHTHILAGASIVLTTQSILQEQFWQVFNRFKCTSLAGVPYTYQLLDRLGLDQLQCPSLKTLTQAGGKMSPALTTKFHAVMQQRQGRFFTMYGQTEATARIAYLPPDDLPKKAGAIGIAIPGGKLQVFNDDDLEVLEPFCEGELVYSGPNVMLGYANSPQDLALGDQLHGVLRTGDVGYFDAEAIFYVSGRLKRFSKVYGQRINLDDIEQTISRFGHIVVTSDDIKIKLYYEKNPGIDTEACLAFLTATFHLPPPTFECIEVEHFLLTASGKIDYTKL